MTVAGTVTPGTLLESPTETPPAPAGLARVTVPVAGWPPVIVEGLMLSDATVPIPGAPVLAGGLTVNGVLTEFALVTVILPATGTLTGSVFTVNVAAVVPSATLMVDGTVMLDVLLVIVAETPPTPAGLARVTVPIEESPPVTTGGFRLTCETVPSAPEAGFTAIGEVTVLALVAVTVAATGVLTGSVLIGKLAVDESCGIVTAGGTITFALLLPRSTVIPPSGAGAARVMAPVVDWPPTTAAPGIVNPVIVPFFRELAAGVAMFTIAERLDPALVAVIVAVAGAEPGLVDIRNSALDWPAGTTTECATVAAGLLLVSVTGRPPAGAGRVKVRVPAVVSPAARIFDPRVREPNSSIAPVAPDPAPESAPELGLSIKVPVTLIPGPLAVSVTGVCETTAGAVKVIAPVV